ncbi:hypothetical protein RB599_003126 [Gaeumannomyces hyphopodioides]
MSHPQAPPVSGSGPPPAGGWSTGTPSAPYQQQPPPQGQGQWQQSPQQEPSPHQPYNQQLQQPQPASHTYGQPYQHQPPALGHTPSPLGSQTPYGQPPAGSPGQPPTGAPATTPPGPGGAPHSAGFAPGVGGPANVAPPQGYAAQGYPGTVPQQGGLMGQVNQAFVSGMPYIQTFSSKLTGKFNRITGHASAYQQHPAPGTYGQPGGYGQPAYGQPQQHQQQPGQIPAQQTQSPPHQQQQQSPPHQQQQQPPPPYQQQQQQQQPSPYGQPVQSPPSHHQQQQPGSYSQPIQSAPPHQQQPSPYSQAPSPYPPTQPTASAPTVSPPPASASAADPLMHSMGALSLDASAAASTPPPYASNTPAPAPAPAPAPTTTLPLATSQKWHLVDPASQQPTPEFRAVAALMFDSLNAQGNQQGFVDATKILGAWQANGLDAQWVELFAYDNYYSFSLMWSLSEIPHVLIPRTPSLVPPATLLGSTPSGPATTTPFAPLTIPVDPGYGKFNDAQLPAYVPALTVGGYTNSLFLDFFDDPASLPNLVRKQIGVAGYADHRLRNHTLPDLDAYDPSVPVDLQSRARAVRAASVERAMAEVAKRRSGAPTAPYVS